MVVRHFEHFAEKKFQLVSVLIKYMQNSRLKILEADWLADVC